MQHIFQSNLFKNFFSVLFCFYSLLQIIREEAKVLFSWKKLHSLQLYHALSWKAWGCDNKTIIIFSQRAQVRGKVSKQSGHTPSPVFHTIWSIKGASHRSVFIVPFSKVCVCSGVHVHVFMLTFYSLTISLRLLILCSL